MVIRETLFLMLAAVLFFTTAAGAQGNSGKGGGNKGGGKNCNSVLPMSVTILPLAGSVLSGDGSDSYIDGQDGVNARIHVCGSNDATITSGNFKKPKRKMNINFPAPEDGSVLEGNAPDWIPGSISVRFFFNVRNVLCETGACANTFTSRMAWRFQGPDGIDYRLPFYPEITDAPDTHSPNMLLNEPDINEPMETSPVLVTYTPGNCSTVSLGETVIFDQWLVNAANLNPDGIVQVGTLHTTDNNAITLHKGQYSMRFRLLLEALECYDKPFSQ